MCYSVIIGKKASQTGKVILAANDDWPGCPGHVLFEEAHDYKAEDSFRLVGGDWIPQVSHTYAYVHSSAAYETGWRKESWNEGVNEKNVSVSLDGIYAFKDIKSEGGLQADDLPILILERASSAREAVVMVGELIEKHGFSVSSIEGAAGAVVLAIADPEEGYFLEVLPGGVWAAKRVLDDEVEVRPNCLGIQNIDFSSPETFLYSDNMVQTAVENEWYQKNTPFNFAEIFSSDRAICDYGGPKDEVNMYRRWNGIFKLANKDTDLEAQEYSAKATEGSVSVEMVKQLLGDYMADTKYDLSKVPEAGQHHNPYFMDINISVGQAGTVVAMVIDYSFLEDGNGALAWYCYGNAGIAPFVPCFVQSKGLPEIFQNGTWGEYSTHSAWFIMEDLCELVYRRYDAVIDMVREKAEEWKIVFERKVAKYEAKKNGEEIKTLTDEYAKWLVEQVVQLCSYLRGHCLANSFCK